METIILKIVNKEYSNEECVKNAVSYIYRLKKAKHLPVFCYGCEYIYESVMHDFYHIHDLYRKTDRYLQHIILSFPYKRLAMEEKFFADKIAALFSGHYLVCYALHTDTEHDHFHFLICAASYLPDIRPLEGAVLEGYISLISQMAADEGFLIQVKEDNSMEEDDYV